MNQTFEQSVESKAVVLSVSHVAKTFKLPTEQATGLKMAFLNWTKGVKGYTEQQVLQDISFEVHEGDFFGIVGRNGSGKSTLLKIISGIYVPEKGNVSTVGKLVPFIELGVGFNPELTGRENVYLNGALLGFSREEIASMYDDIVSFAELEDFMDQKLKNYSSGMQVRLAFSVAIKAQGDILVLDEVLAVGDEAFQRKCDSFFAQIKKDPKKTVILVTHSMESVKKYCNNAILIKNGEIVAQGDTNDVADRYTLENLKKKEQSDKVEQVQSTYPLGLNERVPILRVNALSSPVIDGLGPFIFEVEYEFCETNTEFYLAIALWDVQRGGVVYDTGSKALRMNKTGHVKVQYTIPTEIFNNGRFRLVASLRTPNESDEKATDMVAFTSDENSCFFVVSNERNRDYALLSDRVLRITRIREDFIGDDKH